MRIIETLLKDEELQALREQLYDMTGRHLGFNHDCYSGLEEYKEHLRACVEAGKIISRPKDEIIEKRFDALWER